MIVFGEVSPVVFGQDEGCSNFGIQGVIGCKDPSYCQVSHNGLCQNQSSNKNLAGNGILLPFSLVTEINVGLLWQWIVKTFASGKKR